MSSIEKMDKYISNDADFNRGILYCLDCVLIRGEDTLAVELMYGIDTDSLLKTAKSDDYHNIKELRRIIKESK